MDKDILTKFEQNNNQLISLMRDYDGEIAQYLSDIREFHKIDLIRYAEVQLGLAKYLDFQWDHLQLNNSNIQTLVTNITTLAYHLLQIYINQCHQMHEDGACLIGWLDYTRVNQDLSLTHWPNLPIADTFCFSGKINPITLPTGTKIYRIIGKNKIGHWWLPNKPHSKKLWRLESAVSEQWSDGTKCIEVELIASLNIWYGVAASQAVPKSLSKCYLKGGAFQIWCSPGDLKRHNITESLWP